MQATEDVLRRRLRYDLRYQRDGKAVELMAKKGKKAPDWYYDVPELLPTEHFMMEAFWSLSTSRNNGMSTGPIPWDSVQRYAEIHDLGFEQAKLLHRCIRALDNEFLKHLEKEREREEKVRANSNG